ncbi:MAG: hypothetical protein ACT4PL_09335, partial [Phycisphaerales bacterium]
MLIRHRTVGAAALLMLAFAAQASGQIVDHRIPLNYNYHGMAHGPEAVPGAAANNADLINYRSISDRGLYYDLADVHAFGSLPLVGFTGIQYGLFDTLGYSNTNSIDPETAESNALDMVHLGNRTLFRFFETAPGDPATNRGNFPAWAPDAATNCDHATQPQLTVLSTPIVVDGLTEIGVLYHASDSGGQFDVFLTFNDGNNDTFVTARLACPDWFGPQSNPAIVANQPVSFQRRVQHTVSGVTYNSFRGVDQEDTARLTNFVLPTEAGPNLKVIEGIISVPAIVAAGQNIVGQELRSIAFRNASWPTRTITALTGNGTVATATANAHGLIVGTPIIVSGANVAGLNGSYTIASVPTANTFTYANTTVAASTTGTRTVFGVGAHRGYGIYAVTARTGAPLNANCATPQAIVSGTNTVNNLRTAGAAP